ncbi:THUMP domain-containing protein 1 [Thelohanellus kitauei]|uniref:THUMP domain-containing protein 1 n=1 Tax=Thelohanellus kitauei TaxID=669202 RepID=A0A0C2MUB5_THEKT|nr:THUMP domain-containing protein 1 [Thelohanellus kitauei]
MGGKRRYVQRKVSRDNNIEDVEYDQEKTPSSKPLFKPGITGFLITANNENNAKREALLLFNQVILNSYYFIENENETVASSSNDPLDLVANECENLKHKEKTFRLVATKCRNYIFIQSLVPPVEILKQVFEKLLTSEQKIRYCLRCYPILASCHSNLDNFKSSFEKTFTSILNEMAGDRVKFELSVKVRSHPGNKKEIYEYINTLVSEAFPNWVHCHKEYEFKVLFYFMRNVCMMSFLENDKKYKKYNLNAF